MSVAVTMGAQEKDGLRITIDELKGMLGKPNVVILDVRDPVGWSKSDIKIVGAVREDQQDVGAWAKKYPKTETIVVYCA